MAGTPIREKGLSNSVNPQITHGPLFQEFQACVEAGLDLERWLANEYDPMFKAHVMAWYEGRNLIEAHTKDAVRKAEERQMAAARKKKR